MVVILHSAEITNIYSHQKLSSNQLFSNVFAQNIVFTKFLRKKV